MVANKYSFTHTWYSVFEQIEGKKHVLSVLQWEEKYSYSQILRSGRIGCLTVIYDTKILGKRYMPYIKKRQDLALWLDILKSTEYIWCLQEELASYRKVEGSISSSKISLVKYHWEIFRNLQKLGRLRSAFYLSTYITYYLFRSFSNRLRR